MRTLIRRLWPAKHRPALVSTEHRGATAEYATELAHVKTIFVSDELLTDDERAAKTLADIDNALEPALTPLFAEIDATLAEFMVRHRITWEHVDAYAKDAEAQKVVDQVKGSIRRLAEELALEVAVSTPTGEYAVVTA